MNENKKTLLKKIEPLLECLECKNNLSLEEDGFKCENCGQKYPIIDGIPRFVPENFWKLDNSKQSLDEKTKNYFGYEWEFFEKWGFYDDKELSDEEKKLYVAATVETRKKTFNSKCRMTEENLSKDKTILDAGCGNGRYTYEAAIRGEALIIGVDLGYGSVKSAYSNTKELDNVIILQANLFNLPFKKENIDNCFSNGVLMHTGNAPKAFKCVSEKIKSGGIFVAHVYNTLNPLWEFNDFIIRFITTRLNIDLNMKFARFMANIGRIAHKNKKIYEFVNLLLRAEGHPILMFDWYAAPIATHHSYKELAKWFEESNFDVLDKIPKRGIIKQPWGINLKGKKK